MISDFVERRGGGLLMLGGPRSFAEGGYAGTPVADALPVILERPARMLDVLPVARLHVKPTKAGEAHGVTQIAATEAASTARWSDMPVLTSVNTIREVKPGATVLLNGTDERRRDRSCSPRSATAAARRSRSRFRTPGTGRWTSR